MSTKKVFQDIVALLEANKDMKVSKILPQVLELTSAKSTRVDGGASIKNSSGQTVAILDYYFKRWLPLVGEAAVEFGAKANTNTGFNTMCKEGVSHWTKQQRIAKQAQQALLNLVAAGEVKPEDIQVKLAEIEAEKNAVVETTLGFATKEEVLAYLVENGEVVG